VEYLGPDIGFKSFTVRTLGHASYTMPGGSTDMNCSVTSMRYDFVPGCCCANIFRAKIGVRLMHNFVENNAVHCSKPAQAATVRDCGDEREPDSAPKIHDSRGIGELRYQRSLPFRAI
jgi:hypothetical protein